MRWYSFILVFVFFPSASFAQTVPDPVEQSLESSVEKNGEETEADESFPLQLQLFRKHPLSLNTATPDDLRELGLLTPVQVDQLISYRDQLGPFISLDELQAIPGWDPVTARKVRPYLTVSYAPAGRASIRKMIMHAEQSILLRGGQVLEKASGYHKPDSSASSYYPGSGQKWLLRYSGNYKRRLQWGILAEKDAGEQFFKGRQRMGFDFYSFHVLIRDLGHIKTLVIGDYTVNLGQGLVQWQGLGFTKSADAMAIKREGDVFRAYRSAGEYNFHRGVAISIRKWKKEAGVFGSYKKTDANRAMDTLSGSNYITSLQTSGYHRTGSESADKGSVREFITGAYLKGRIGPFRLGAQFLTYRFSGEMRKPGYPYNKYGFQGRSLTNYSLDFGFTRQNLHWFGEIAGTGKGDMALVSGVMVSVAHTADISLLYRNISKGYQSFYSSAFTESSAPVNESGIYAGITLRPTADLRIDAFADIYRFPWLKYRVDKPSTGSEFFVQAFLKPSKQWELYTRYRRRSGLINDNPAELTLSPVMPEIRKNWRMQIQYKISPSMVMRSRTEWLWYNKPGERPEEGFFISLDMLYKYPKKPLNAGIRLQYFETDGYNSRIYAFENDVLYYYSIPVFYDKGYRYYININYDFNKKLSAWLKWSQVVYPGKTLIGSGLDQIPGNRKSEIRLQVMAHF